MPSHTAALWPLEATLHQGFVTVLALLPYRTGEALPVF